MILSLMQAGKFSSADGVIDEELRLVARRYESAETGREAEQASGRTPEQLANLRRLGQKLDAMPAASVADGLTNRDHDRILYGR